MKDLLPNRWSGPPLNPCNNLAVNAMKEQANKDCGDY